MRAFAKINLYLHVTGKRNDGYHLLDSLMTKISLYDELEVLGCDSLKLEISGVFNDKISTTDNIILNAAKLLASEAGIEKPTALIKLNKKIPVGAGLGGGSSDAAATLKLLNEFWNIHFSNERLMQIGLKLGADVPFCLNEKAAYISGVGEVIENCDKLPSLNILLVNPCKSLSTKEVFNYAPINFSSAANRNEDIFSILKSNNNDLEKNAIAMLPELECVLDSILIQPGCYLARMSGSGSTCFGLFESRDQLIAAHYNIAMKHKDWLTWSVDNI